MRAPRWSSSGGTQSDDAHGGRAEPAHNSKKPAEAKQNLAHSSRSAPILEKIRPANFGRSLAPCLANIGRKNGRNRPDIACFARISALRANRSRPKVTEIGPKLAGLNRPRCDFARAWPIQVRARPSGGAAPPQAWRKSKIGVLTKARANGATSHPNARLSADAGEQISKRPSLRMPDLSRSNDTWCRL